MTWQCRFQFLRVICLEVRQNSFLCREWNLRWWNWSRLKWPVSLLFYTEHESHILDKICKQSLDALCHLQQLLSIKPRQAMSLMKTVGSYRPSCEEVTQARVLLLGPVNSGKSSFISSVQSVFNGRVTNRAMVGSSSTSFTKKVGNKAIRCRKKHRQN